MFLFCVSAKVKQFLKDSLTSQNSAVTLAHIAALEKKLIKHFQVKDFLALEMGNFLEFLVKHNQVQAAFHLFCSLCVCMDVNYLRVLQLS